MTRERECYDERSLEQIYGEWCELAIVTRGVKADSTICAYFITFGTW